VEQTLSLVTAYGGYILAEDLGGSGVIGVVTAGLIIGNLSLVPGEQPQKRSTMIEFWEFIIFLVNSVVFLLLGDQILFPYFLEHVDTSLVAIAAVLISRGIAIYGFSAISGWLTQNPIPWAEQTVLWWVGLRGSVAIALALSIPDWVPDRQQIISNSFGVVLFTLLIQGLTSKWLLDRLNLLTDEKLYQQYLTLVAQRDALQKILTYLLDGDRKPVIEADQFQRELDFVKTTLTTIQTQLATMREANPLLEGLILKQHQAQLTAIESSTYTNFVQGGLLKEIPPSVIEQVFGR
jgi:CPA1 family monovalent cation:H+ antiporter